MKKINVVKNNQEFNDVIKTGFLLKNNYFVLYTKKNELKRFRFGISVPKKVCNAVNRNRLKRKIRNILDNHKNLYSKEQDYIIILRKSCLDATYQELENNLVYLFEKLKEKDDANEKNHKK